MIKNIDYYDWRVKIEQAEGGQLREWIMQIRRDMLHGRMSYDEAKAMAQPILDEINKRNKVIAKSHRKTPQVLTFTRAMR